MTLNDHAELLEKIHSMKGMVIISGFSNDYYQTTLKGWRLVTRESSGQAGKCKGSKMNTECLWISPNAVVQERLCLI